ncbi:MAG: outer membrane lipoprotein carrier protein LolA [Bacteroidales bacterium]|jgi:outer membrane lipoprotein-sorting protein|nr:outer membrane lipoprotein carrier protein LolA [Bacteroidales bacterium]
MHGFIFLLLFPAFLYGQEDTRAQKIIDDMVARIGACPSVQLTFSATVTRLQDKSESMHDGKLWLKNNRYKLELLPDNILLFNGEKLYQFLPEVNEVNVTQPDMNEDDEDFQLFNPRTFFRLSSKNFKSHLVRESTQNNRKVYEMDLYPLQVKTTKYSRVRVCVEKETLQIVRLTAFMKDGTQYALTFQPYTVLKALPDSFFEFSVAEHPGVEIIDLTF